jgi:peptidoglycan/xylan/chitin deacetylase (PgdA/CDA1 family)
VRHRIPDIVPYGLRLRLSSWHPGRARRWRKLPGVQRVDDTSAVLTFDDGPAPDATPRVLRALAESQLQATFFVLGSAVLEQPELAREIVEGGHEIALHGFHHVRHDRLTPAQAREDIEAGLDAIERTTQRRPRWFRPPYGRMSVPSQSACQELGLGVAYWSAWGLDWEDVDEQTIISEVRSGLSGGSIVLLHDTARYGRRATADPTVQAIKPIAAHGRKRGLSWRTLTDAAHDRHS